MAYVNIIECPNGCKGSGGKPIAATLQGWKKHMTRNHGGYTEEQLAIAGSMLPLKTGAGGDPAQGEFEAMRSGAPETEGGEFTAPVDIGTGLPAEPSTDDAKPNKATRKLSGEMKAMKKNFADQIPKIISVMAASKGPEWGLDSEEQGMVAEACNSMLTVLDIEFNFQPINMQLNSPFWALLFPIMVLALIFAKKGAKNAGKEKDDIAA